MFCGEAKFGIHLTIVSVSGLLPVCQPPKSGHLVIFVKSSLSEFWILFIE